MRSRQGSKSRLVWILLGAAIVLVVIAAVAGAVYLVLRQQRTTALGWQDPIAALDAGQITPDPALYPLAGSSTLETIDAAMAVGRLETAYAAVVFSSGFTDLQRIGRLLSLGGRFAQADQPAKASLAYHQVYDLAVLSPTLSDPARADALLAAGQGWAALKIEDEALDAYGQVRYLATSSPYLYRAQRRTLLTSLEVTYRALDATEEADWCVQEVRTLDEQGDSILPPQPAELPDLPAETSPVSSPEIGALEEARRQAAYALIQSVALTEGQELLPDLVDALSQALLAEDAAKLALYRQDLDATTQPSRRVDVHVQVIRWLLLKYQVATGGFGLSLVSDWEAQTADIRSALTKEYEDLLFDYEDLVTALPDVSLLAPSRYWVLRTITLAGRLGHYPDYPSEQMADKVRQAALDLIASGSSLQLYVDSRLDAGNLSFFLALPADYGQPQETR